ncbi:MAG TPA: sulfurtransferase TusA family protein [Desulfuromonadaceae bacterium]
MTANNDKIVVHNLCGQICPSTLLVALREINKNFSQLNNGEVKLLFKTNNRDSTNTIPEAAGNMGLKVSVQKQESHYEILVSKV